MAAQIDKNTCTGCETCIGACPVAAIFMDGSVAKVNADECIDCGACVGECPVNAISL